MDYGDRDYPPTSFAPSGIVVVHICEAQTIKSLEISNL